jgi:thymidylate synthase (FAD)
MDKLFRIEIISKTPNPQQTIYAAMHQDYSESFVWDDRDKFPDEERSGELVIKHLLAGGRGHFGPIEHPQIVLNCGWFPHSVMQQIRTHRIASFDVQSMRYTGLRVCEVAGMIREACKNHYPSREQVIEMIVQFEQSDLIRQAIEEIIYLRPIGDYTSRNGAKYRYSELEREDDLQAGAEAILRYAHKIEFGYSEEHARGMLPFDYRQHWVMSFNARSLMHLLDLRAKADAQLECQWLCDLIWPHFNQWMPQIAEWYHENRWGKARLAP